MIFQFLYLIDQKGSIKIEAGLVGGDFLSNGRIANQNKKLLSYDHAKELVNNLNITTLKQYKIIQSDYVNILPVHPHLTYKNKGYKTYEEFFRP